MKNRKSLPLTILLFLAAGLFAQENAKWYICAGSFKNETNANARVELLRTKYVDSFVAEFPADGLYRVLLSEPFDTLKQAHKRRSEYNAGNIFRVLGISGIWCVQYEIPSEPVPSPAPVYENLEENRYILIKDSDTGAPVANADVNIDNKWKTRTSAEGKAPLPDNIPDGEHNVTVTKDDYVSTSTRITVSENHITSVPQISLPRAVDYERYKIILEWGAVPRDLDSHIIGNGHHVYFNNMNEANFNLDLDDTSGYGPETITIRNPIASDYYSYFVHDYTNSGFINSKEMSDSQATVKVYFGNEYKTTFTITPNIRGFLWHVFDIKDGEIIPVNKIMRKSLYGRATGANENFILDLGYPDDSEEENTVNAPVENTVSETSPAVMEEQPVVTEESAPAIEETNAEENPAETLETEETLAEETSTEPENENEEADSDDEESDEDDDDTDNEDEEDIEESDEEEETSEETSESENSPAIPTEN